MVTAVIVHNYCRKRIISYYSVHRLVILMWTMVTVHFSSEGAKASDVDKIMREIGFVTTLGENDYVYKWEKDDATTEEDYRKLEEKVIILIDDVQKKLQGKNVYLRFRTIRSF